MNNNIRFLTILLLLMTSLGLSAQVNLIGQWYSQIINEGSENMVMGFKFHDDKRMELSFITDNQVPGVGHSVTRMAAQGQYKQAGALFTISIDTSTITAEILKLDIISNYDTSLSWYKELLYKESQKEVLSSAHLLLNDYQDEVPFIFVTHKDNDDIFSLIIGDETDVLLLDFTHQNPLDTFQSKSTLNAVDYERQLLDSINLIKAKFIQNPDAYREEYAFWLYSAVTYYSMSVDTEKLLEYIPKAYKQFKLLYNKDPLKYSEQYQDIKDLMDIVNLPK